MTPKWSPKVLHDPQVLKKTDQEHLLVLDDCPTSLSSFSLLSVNMLFRFKFLNPYFDTVHALCKLIIKVLHGVLPTPGHD